MLRSTPPHEARVMILTFDTKAAPCEGDTYSLR